MHRIDSPGNVGSAWVAGNPIAGVAGTVMDSAWFNAAQEEICGLIEAEGLVLVKGTNTQLRAAIAALVNRLTGVEVSFVSAGTITAGQGLLLGDTFGVVKTSAVATQTSALLLGGARSLAKAVGAIAQFARVYWDDTAKLVTTVAGGNRSIGVAAVAALSAAPTVTVLLSGPPNV